MSISACMHSIEYASFSNSTDSDIDNHDWTAKILKKKDFFLCVSVIWDKCACMHEVIVVAGIWLIWYIDINYFRFSSFLADWVDESAYVWHCFYYFHTSADDDDATRQFLSAWSFGGGGVIGCKLLLKFQKEVFDCPENLQI